MLILPKHASGPNPNGRYVPICHSQYIPNLKESIFFWIRIEFRAAMNTNDWNCHKWAFSTTTLFKTVLFVHFEPIASTTGYFLKVSLVLHSFFNYVKFRILEQTITNYNAVSWFNWSPQSDSWAVEHPWFFFFNDSNIIIVNNYCYIPKQFKLSLNFHPK